MMALLLAGGRRARWPLAPLLFCLALLTGCDQVTFSDSIDLDFDFSLTRSDTLNLPYVTGSEMSLFVVGADGAEAAGWTFESSDPTVFRIEDDRGGSADCVAVRAGTVEVSVRDEDGDVVHEATIEVADPTRVTLLPHGPLLVDWEAPVERSGVDVLTDGTATLLVRFFRGDQRLYGNGTLSVGSGPDLIATPETTFLFEDREWLQLTPLTEGRHEVDLFFDGRRLGALEVRARTADEVASIELRDEPTRDPEEDDLRVALGLARLEDGTPVYGVDFTWDLDGIDQEGTGDLFRYTYDSNATSRLGVAFDGLGAQADISATEGFVDSSNDLGCHVAARVGGLSSRPSSTAWSLGLGIMGCALRARRRRRSENPRRRRG
ncbi:MAG: hypothetical protein AAGN82_03460 [Myxococcota bacterium]